MDTAAHPQILQSPSKMIILNPRRGLVLSNLKGWWLAGPQSGVDQSGLGHTATITGSPSWATMNHYDGLVLTSSSQYASITDASDLELGSGDFTIGARVYLTGYSPGWSGAYSAAVVAKDESGASGRAFSFQINGTSSSWTGLSIILFVSDAVYTISEFNYTFSLNTEYYVEATRISGTMYLRVNGSEIGSGANTRSVQNNAKAIRIGRANNTGYDYNLPGRISDIRIYVGRGLSTAESAAIAIGIG